MSKTPAGKYNWLVFLAVITVLLSTGVFSRIFLFSFQLKPETFQFDTAMQILGPAIIVALFVERAVEVLVVTWQKFGRQMLEHVKELLETKPDGDTIENHNKCEEKTEELFKYRTKTLDLPQGLPCLSHSLSVFKF